MRFTYLTKLGAVAATAAMALTMASTDAYAQQKVRWKMHSAYGTEVSVLGPIGPYIAETVRTLSDGDFDIKVFEPGALTGGFAYYDPISQGAIDIAYGTPGASAGKNSLYAFAASWPFGPSTGPFLAWLRNGGGEELISEVYARDNIKFMVCGLIPPETAGWFREEITSLDQFKGMKMRFFGMGALVMQKLGVSTQLLAPGDIYPALELGTLDATEFSLPSSDRTLGFYQVAKYNYFPGWHQQSTVSELLINMDAWNALSDKNKFILETACDAAVGKMFADGEAAQAKAMLANQADGVMIKKWSPEFLDAFRGAWEEVLAEELAANEDVKRFWASWTAFDEEYKIWGENGYLD